MLLLRLLPLLQYFNSIKVRLEHSESSPTKLMLEFQFHKGAIRTINSLVVKDYPLKFQFHKGAIRTSLTITRKVCINNISIP